MKKNIKSKKRRLLFMPLFFILLLIILIGRLVNIQIIECSKYKEGLSNQSVAVLSGLKGRGIIYDRSGNYLTGMEESFVFLLEKRKVNETVEVLLEKENARKLNHTNPLYNLYSITSPNREVRNILCKDYDALIIKVRERYQEIQPAIHVIGYVNKQDETGVCGIEKDFDAILSSVKKAYYGQADGQGYLIPGFGINIKGESGDWGVLTTLDLEFQKIAERALFDAGVSGAVIITDSANGEILASASSPVYNPHQIVDYLQSSEKEFLNKATNCQYPPGSIFKIIVAAAALEKGVVTPNSIFTCTGYHEVEGISVKCSTGGKQGHGEITLREAFAQSCNAVFVQVGQLAGGEDILDMARTFGLSEEPVIDLSGQGSGNLPLREEVLGAGIGNLSIGQGKLLVTPMQVARMTQIIAADGIDCGLTLIRGTIEGIKGKILLSPPAAKQVISRETARAIKEMMMQTVMTGTGDNLALSPGLSAAGKTGSAEAFYEENSSVHSWFTGFVPADCPQYCITVFIENGGSGRKAAVPIFQKIIEEINFD
ncbi:MAG: penicillin-binding protein 2 [Eubacteriales bacterium]|nr:penicillin-binding protein 2 [Eubacteriales bacterium]